MTSALVMRPSLPVPSTIVASRSCSSSRRLTAGLSLGDVFATSTGSADRATTCGFSPSTEGTGSLTSPSSSSASNSPLVTVVPSLTLMSLSVPDAGAGTSSTTLSVSRSTRFSSRMTDSPAFLYQLTSVASVTDSGSCGTLISIVIVVLLVVNGRLRLAGFYLQVQCSLDQLLLFL